MFSNRKTFVSLICEQRVLLQTLFQNRCRETLFHQLGKKLVRDYLFLATESWKRNLIKYFILASSDASLPFSDALASLEFNFQKVTKLCFSVTPIPKGNLAPLISVFFSFCQKLPTLSLEFTSYNLVLWRTKSAS